MSHQSELTPYLHNIIKTFKNTLKKYFNNHQFKKQRETQAINFYEEAKKAQTQERNLFKALEFYTKAIQNGEKKDSSIKDFASSLHQLGYTKEAVRLMDDCQYYYEGNKEKYFRLRDNLEIQINPTGKHLCRYILIENISEDIKVLGNQEGVKNALFKCPKRIKKIYFLQDLSLDNLNKVCQIQLSSNILVEFESFSAAKKTLESFAFQEWFASNLYWVNFKTMRIFCAALDAKKDFQEGFIVDDQIVERYVGSEQESFWATFGEKVYTNKRSNGFINLLSTHLIKDHLIEVDKERQNKENIFESSKIHQSSMRYSENSLHQFSHSRDNMEYQRSRFYENGRRISGASYKNNLY